MNDLAATLGSGLRLNNDTFDPLGDHTTTDIVPSQFTQGVEVIQLRVTCRR